MVLYDDQEGHDLVGWGMLGGRLKRKGIYVYKRPVYFVLHQKLTQNCTVIILELKKSRHLLKKKFFQNTKAQASVY